MWQLCFSNISRNNNLSVAQGAVDNISIKTRKDSLNIYLQKTIQSPLKYCFWSTNLTI